MTPEMKRFIAGIAATLNGSDRPTAWPDRFVPEETRHARDPNRHVQ